MRCDADTIANHVRSADRWLADAGIPWRVYLERDAATGRWSVWKRWATGSRTCTASGLTNRELVAMLEGMKIALEAVVHERRAVIGK